MQALLTNRMKRKLALVFALIVLALIGVNVRLAYINKTSGDKYTKKVLAQQDTNSVVLPFRRGDILDRNGTILATSREVLQSDSGSEGTVAESGQGGCG